MAGIYIHIPFCKQACYYCNFHFSTSLAHRDVMVDAILKEMDMSQRYLGDQKVHSIYFGGGTPSLLPIQDITRILKHTYALFSVAHDAEITLESNPDDMSLTWLTDLKQYTSVNRLSIGVQSFQNEDLIWMNRAHNAGHAQQCLEDALSTGFDNLTIDLIYGSPTTPDEIWEKNLSIASNYNIPHLSCYALTVEEGTALDHFVKKGTSLPVDEERSARQLEILMDYTEKAGYEQYEISNFAYPGRHARHNSNYWLGEHYLGLGPSAHSFNGKTRQWNVANNAKYIAGIQTNELLTELEVLTPKDRFNECIMTMLRTHWGVKVVDLRLIHPEGANAFEKDVQKYIQQGLVQCTNDAYLLTKPGRLLADRIAMELFVN
jgi:putative oxygen-independent coproporphyrinogen III oxidase